MRAAPGAITRTLAALAICSSLWGQGGSGPTELSIETGGIGLLAGTAQALERAINRGDWRQAEALLFAETAERPDRAETQRALGIAHFQAGRPFAAAMALKRSDRMTRLDAGARLLLATAYIRLGRQHWARAELEDLVHSSPTDPRYRLALARLHYEDQRFSEAAELVRPVIASEPGLAEAHDLLGQCLEGLGEVDAAKRAYAAAISLSARAGRRDAWPHYHLGSLLHDLGELEASRDVLRAAVERDPANGAALWALGIVLDKLDDLDGARSALEAAARASPQNGRIQYSIARVYRRLGLAERANAAMERFRAFANPPR